VFKAHTTHRKGASKLRTLDYAERSGFIKGVVKAVIHDPGRGAPVVQVHFRNPYRFKVDKEVMVAAEGIYSGQFLYCGRKGESSPMPVSTGTSAIARGVVIGSLVAVAHVHGLLLLRVLRRGAVGCALGTACTVQQLCLGLLLCDLRIALRCIVNLAPPRLLLNCSATGCRQRAARG
jgi:hypothetical protein